MLQLSTSLPSSDGAAPRTDLDERAPVIELAMAQDEHTPKGLWPSQGSQEGPGRAPHGLLEDSEEDLRKLEVGCRLEAVRKCGFFFSLLVSI